MLQTVSIITEDDNSSSDILLLLRYALLIIMAQHVVGNDNDIESMTVVCMIEL